MSAAPLGFIGGTGVDRLTGWPLAPRRVDTAYGAVTVHCGEAAGRPVAFLPRHGEDHAVPPHAINHRANIAALKLLGVRDIVATSAVGTLTKAIPPGALALLTDFIDHTHGRAGTFFTTGVVHLDYSAPYCTRLRAALRGAAVAAGVPLCDGATYLCTNGPRFETAAEIRAFAQWGADLVGMTNVPEVVLAREAEICYTAVAISTNYAAGLAGHPLTHGEVEEMMAARAADLGRLLAAFARCYDDTDCACRHALDEYRARVGGVDPLDWGAVAAPG